MDLRLLIVDPHELTREGLRAILDGQPGMTVVGDCAPGPLADELASSLAPDVIIVEASLGIAAGSAETDPETGSDPTEDREALLSQTQCIILQLAGAAPQAHIIALSSRRGHRLLAALLGAGASACLLKGSGTAELLKAIEHVMDGKGRYLGPGLADALVDDCRSSMAHQSTQGLARLSERERQILHMLAEGMGTKQMAGVLEISRKTVEIHRRRLMRKLSVDSVAGLTRHAMREGIAGPFDPPSRGGTGGEKSQAGPFWTVS